MRRCLHLRSAMMQLRSAQLLPDLYDLLGASTIHSKKKFCYTSATKAGRKQTQTHATNLEQCQKHYGLREEQKITNSRRLFSTYYCTKKCTRLLSRQNTRITAHKFHFFSRAQSSDASELYECLPVGRGCKSTYRLAIHLYMMITCFYNPYTFLHTDEFHAIR